MSGGPVLNRQGQLIGIHGASKLIGSMSGSLRRETRGVDPITGSKFGLNLAIPIDTFLRLVPRVEPSLKVVAIPPQAPPPQPTAADLFIQSIDREADGDLSGKPTSAITLLDEAIRLQPNFALAYFTEGKC
jgi:S1-C subfamily serine protease